MKTYKQQLKNFIHALDLWQDIEDLDYEADDEWQERARRLQERRWKKLEMFNNTEA